MGTGYLPPVKHCYLMDYSTEYGTEFVQKCMLHTLVSLCVETTDDNLTELDELIECLLYWDRLPSIHCPIIPMYASEAPATLAHSGTFVRWERDPFSRKRTPAMLPPPGAKQLASDRLRISELHHAEQLRLYAGDVGQGIHDYTNSIQGDHRARTSYFSV